MGVAATLGIPGVVTVPEAMTMLSRGILARDAQGREVRFGDRLVGKYGTGLGRASTDVRRLQSVGRAVLAVRSANAGVVELPGHRPVQRQYHHRLGAKGAIVVYVEAETGSGQSVAEGCPLRRLCAEWRRQASL